MRLECSRPHSRNLPSAGLFVLGRMSMNYALLDSGYALDYDWRFLTCHLEYNEIQFDMGSVQAWSSTATHINIWKDKNYNATSLNPFITVRNRRL
jgi:hypothetical protein